jgi:hypothetical protein
MPFIPRFKSLGFSGIFYKKESLQKEEAYVIRDVACELIYNHTFLDILFRDLRNLWGRRNEKKG